MLGLSWLMQCLLILRLNGLYLYSQRSLSPARRVGSVRPSDIHEGFIRITPEGHPSFLCVLMPQTGKLKDVALS